MGNHAQAVLTQGQLWAETSKELPTRHTRSRALGFRVPS